MSSQRTVLHDDASSESESAVSLCRIRKHSLREDEISEDEPLPVFSSSAKYDAIEARNKSRAKRRALLSKYVVKEKEAPEADHFVSNSIKFKRWFITLFKYSREDVLKWFEDNKGDIRQCCVCEDNAPTTGIYHLHIAVCFLGYVRFNRWLSWFPKLPHRFESMNGSYRDARNYVLGRKDGHSEGKKTVLDFNPPVEKEVSRTEEFWLAVQEEPTYENVENLLKLKRFAFMIPHMEAALKYCARFYVPEERKSPLVVVYFYGRPGSGKSTVASQLFSNFARRSSASFSPSGQLIGIKDFDDCVMFDDLNIGLSTLQHEFLFKLLDKFPFVADVKQTTRVYQPKLVIITRVEAIDEFETEYKWKKVDVEQFERRITFEILCTRTQKPGILNPKINRPDDWDYGALDILNNKPYDMNDVLSKIDDTN